MNCRYEKVRNYDIDYAECHIYRFLSHMWVVGAGMQVISGRQQLQEAVILSVTLL